MKNNKIKRLTKSQVKTYEIKLEELEKKSVENQRSYYEDILNKIFNGMEVESIRKYSLRCLKLSCDPKNNKIHLPYGVLVEKRDNDIIIKAYNNKHWLLLLSFLLVLGIAIIGSSYSAINYYLVKDLNKDIDGDGIADINLDLNSDKEAEINIDIDSDDKPDVNIDYKGNRSPIFNVDSDHDGIKDFNLINQMDDNGICLINCDKDGDGWPDYNLDIDGDGILDIEIDIDGDKKADINFDLDKDMVCDLHCDTNNDKKCDKYCLTTEELDNVDAVKSGASGTVGSKNIALKTGELTLEYEDSNVVYIDEIYPDDQPGYTNNIPTKKFKVTNKSSLYVKYNLRWVVIENDYVTDHFKYKVSSTFNGYTSDWLTAPSVTTPFATEIIIPPFTSQEYSVNFKLEGTGGKQDEDQAKTFHGYIELYLDN